MALLRFIRPLVSRWADEETDQQVERLRGWWSDDQAGGETRRLKKW